MRQTEWFAAMIAVFIFVIVAGCGGGGSSSPVAAGSPTPVPSPTPSPVGVYTGPNADGPSSDPDVCGNYSPAPKITSISPSISPVAGGGLVTIKGSGFANCSPSVPIVVFGNGGNGLVRTYNDNEINVVAPVIPNAQTVDIRISVTNPSYVNPDGSKRKTVRTDISDIDHFTYQ